LSPLPEKILLTAAWIAPMDRPIIRDGGVVFAGERIIAIGDAKPLAVSHPDASRADLGDAVVLPGLVNAHTHLELSACEQGTPAASFVDWILTLQSRAGRTGTTSPADVYAPAVANGVAQCLRFGVTCAGDISQRPQISRAVLRRSTMRAVSYGEVLGMAKLRSRYDRLLPAALDASESTESLRIGLTPHAPYTVELPQYQQCLQLARERSLPLATHLAETPDERTFLIDHAGPFRQLFDRLGEWDDAAVTFHGGPIEFAEFIGLLDYPTLLAHVNYCDDDELAMLVRGRASIAYCPRTHRYFGHPQHRWREMLARGINVAVGTDSCASSPDLNLVDDLRLMHEIAPEFATEALWRIATLHGAKALGWEDGLGSLAAGKKADFVAFDVSTDEPLTEILEADILPREVWIAGERATPRTPADGSPAA
jgi:cytosine/adenosine deaminase-related metal-dependent hydrolase